MKARTASLLFGVLYATVSLTAARAGEPLEVPASKDVTAYSANAAEQWKGEGTRETVQLGFSKDGQMRVFLAFDLADAAARPCGAAVLHLQSEECWPNKDAATIQVHRLLRPFGESSATWGHSMEGDQWANPGGDFDPVPVCGRRLTKKEEGKVAKEIEIDVTPLVQAWQAKRFPNYGMVLCFPASCDSYIRLFSKDSAHAPKLHLHYASAPAKNPDMAAASTLKPVGTRPNLKFEIYAANLNRGAVGLAYKAALRARGGIAPYAWKAEGLPEGLSMSPAGELAGTPGKAGTYTLEVAATGADGKAATAKLDLVIGAPENAAAVVPGGAAKAPDTEKKKEEKKSGALEDE